MYVLDNKSQRILSMDENLHEDIIKLRRNNHFYVNIHDYRKDTIVVGYILHYCIIKNLICKN